MKFNDNEALKFLRKLWGRYMVGLETPPVFEVFMKSPDGKTRVIWANSPEEAVDKIKRLWNKLKLWNWDIWVGVLPRKEAKKRGRGSSGDVIAGAYLWIDFDFKVVNDNVGYKIKEEIDTRGYYEDIDESGNVTIAYKEGNKYVIVNKPSVEVMKHKISYFLSDLFDSDRPYTILVDSGYGYHVYIELSEIMTEEKLEKLKMFESEVIEITQADPHVKDLARVMRLPGTYNNRIRGRPAEVRLVEITDFVADVENLEMKLSDKVKNETKEAVETITPHVEGFKELSEHDILRIVEMLSDAYVEGHRQNICLFFSGWGAWARISPISIAKIIKLLHEKNNDSDPLDMRLSTVVYSYKKLNLWNDDVENKFRELYKSWGITRVSGEEYEPSDNKMPKGRGLYLRAKLGLIKIDEESEENKKRKIEGLEKELSEILGDDRALAIISEIEEIFKKASPYASSIVEILDYDKQIYAVANLRKLVVYRGKRITDDNGKSKIVPKERVFIGAPTKVTVYINPLGGITNYEIVWEIKTRPRALVIGPAPIEDIVGRLRAEGLVVNRRLAEDVLNAIIEGFVRKERADIKEEIESPGFYFVNNNLVSVRCEYEKPDKENLRKALTLLDKLATEWFSHVIDKFALAIRWGIVSPFIYAMKQRNKWVPWIYLYGASFTGKTTIGEIILSIWGLDTKHKKGGSSIDTIARLGSVLSHSTFPTLINEPGNAISKEDIIETLKSAIESTLARSKYIRGSYTDIPALSPIIFASNRAIPRDDALLRRLIVLRFTYGEKIDPARADMFDKEIKPQLNVLRHIGSLVATVVLENPEILDRFDWEELGKRLLMYCYMEADMEPPEWISAKPEMSENVYDDIREAIRAYLVRRVNEEYTRFVGRVEVFQETVYVGTVSRSEVSFSDRVRIVIDNRLLPWAIPKERNGRIIVYLTSEFARELQPITGDIGGLKSLAELLGWGYCKKSFREGGKVITKHVIEVSLDEFIRFLTSGEEDDGQGESLSP